MIKLDAFFEMRKILLDTSIHAPQFCSLPQHELLLRAYRIQMALQSIDVDVSVGLAMRYAHLSRRAGACSAQEEGYSGPLAFHR